MVDPTSPAARTLAVNCSILMKDLALEQRLTHVTESGASAVEFWWPFADAHPGDEDVDAFARAIENAGVSLIGLNLFAGDMAGGDRGILSWPGREDELSTSAQIAVTLGERLGVRRFNVLYGNRLDGETAEEQDALAISNLRAIAPLFEGIEGVLMIEPVSGTPRYPVLTADHAATIVEHARANDGPSNIGVLLDLYHLAANGDDVLAAIEKHGQNAAHVQIADAPGRGAPGTGKLPLEAWAARLRELGYDGWFALEYADPNPAPLDRFAVSTWKELS